MVVNGRETEGEREGEKSEWIKKGRGMQEQDGEGSVACRLEIIGVYVSGQSVIFRVEAQDVAHRR